MSVSQGPGAARGGARSTRLSVEIFPPADPEARRRLSDGLAAVGPHYVSVTFGAGGTTRDRTFDMVAQLVRHWHLDVAAHLTCVGVARADVDGVVRRYGDLGVRRIVALRGDPPGGFDVPYAPHPHGYARTAELVAGIRATAGLEVAVACYPEKHPQSPTLEHDLDLLAAKLDAGASRAITQFFFDNSLYLDLVERVRRRGISAPVVPGILPVVSFSQVRSFAQKCGATIPAWLAERFDGLDDQPDERMRVGSAIAAEQMAGLIDAGVDEFHIYCLNRPSLVPAIRALLALPDPASVAA